MFGEPKIGIAEPNHAESISASHEAFQIEDGLAGIVEKLQRMHRAGETIAGSNQIYTPHEIAGILYQALIEAGEAMYQYDLSLAKTMTDPSLRYSLTDRFAELQGVQRITRSGGLRAAVVVGLVELERSQRSRAMPRQGGFILDSAVSEALTSMMQS